MAEQENNVVCVDFGREDRESARKLARLLSLVADRDADILANPKKYLDAAHDEIGRLRGILLRLNEAFDPPTMRVSFASQDHVPQYEPFRTVTITQDDYDRFKAVEAIMREVSAFR